MTERTLPQPDPIPDAILAAMRLANVIYFEFYGVKPYPPQVTK